MNLFESQAEIACVYPSFIHGSCAQVKRPGREAPRPFNRLHITSDSDEKSENHPYHRTL